MICPLCATFNDPALTPSGRTPPKDWDPIYCVGCRAILCIDHTWPGGLRPPDDADWQAWHSDPRLARAFAAYLNQTREDPDP